MEAVLVIVGTLVCFVAIFGGAAAVMKIAEAKYSKKVPWIPVEEAKALHDDNKDVQPVSGASYTQNITTQARRNGLTPQEVDQVWTQGMAVRAAGLRVYTPSQVVQRITQLHEKYGVRKMWLVLYKPTDLELPFYELILMLVNGNVTITYLAPDDAQGILDNLKSKLKKDERLRIDPQEIDKRVLQEQSKEPFLLQNFAFLTIGKGKMQQKLGFVCIRDDDGKTSLVYEMPPGERERLWPEPAEEPRILGIIKGSKTA